MRFSITIDTEDENTALRLLGALTDAGLVPAVEAAVEEVDVRILPDTRQVLVHDKPVELTRLEFELLLHLCSNTDRVHRRRELLSAVWDVDDDYSGGRTVDVHVRRVRKKLGDAAEIVQTVRGVGYLVASSGRFRVERSPNVVRLADRRAG
ncbi:winged helix-turn-helix domain-containing protein [Lentzea sp. BCCO 10_0798]|uniref:Winged helix-turn-helix domain-containing protein n=1 Tax=Lentzea kristufekii TaxID=3095430 RepID=A0ABU4TST9_9PSEU|nr:winged helix-turn-helix domain-containing protein [Lentzea sp. BCCO 10_0798]MDX8051119.1 winged helix-turn-helix domain-containing protein [Lentzea sp. BCCO 10_0798]